MNIEDYKLRAVRKALTILRSAVLDWQLKKCCLVYTDQSSCVIQDLSLLRELIRTDDVHYSSLLSLFLLLRKMANNQLLINWGGEGQSLTILLIFGKLLHKKVIAMIFGSEISLGDRLGSHPSFRNRIVFAMTRILLDHVDCVICPSQFSLRESRQICKPKQALMIYHAIDAETFAPSGLDRRTILTVSRNELRRKGIDRFIQLASMMPDKIFTIIGSACKEQEVRNANLPNLYLAGEVSKTQLIKHYQQARFYVQLSRHEAFGISVAEAMSCGSVPVVSDAGSLPEIVSDSGFVILGGDPAKAKIAIEQNWNNYEVYSQRSRTNVVQNFSLRRRTEQLRSIISR